MRQPVKSTSARETRRNTRTGARIAMIAFLCASAGLWVEAPAAAQGRGRGGGPAVVTPVDVEGELDVIYEDNENSARLLHFLKTSRGRLPLQFRDNVPELPTGARVRVRGESADGTTVVATSVTTVTVSTARTTGTQDVLVILMNFTANPVQPYTQAAATAVNTQVHNFYLENSYGQTTMNFTVTPWVTIAGNTSSCDYNGWAGLADTAARGIGHDPAQYDRVVYAFPQLSVCSWWGLGNLSGPRSWVNGAYALRVVAHEQAHNFGDYHSHANKCDATGCTSVEYGDDRDVLGQSGVVGHLGAYQKERLGWLNYGPSPAIQTVTSADNYWIDVYNTPNSGHPKALKVWNPAAGNHFYIEARAKLGFDGNVAAGVTIRSGSPTVGNSAYQQDLAPGSTTWDSTLDVGQTFTDAATNISFTTLSADATGALVQVGFGTAPCVAAAPTLSLSPSGSVLATPGVPVTVTARVTNNDSATCSPTSFSLSIVVPSSTWAVAYGASGGSLGSIPPGMTASTTISITPPTGTSGTFGFTVRAGDGSGTVRASLSATITVAPSITVTGSASRNSRWTSLSARVMGGSLPVPSASVSFVVRSPTGATSTYNAVTATDGTASAKFKSSAKDTTGTWQVTITASKNGSTGTTTTSFVVQ
jgi:hypothetical protein